MRFSVVTTLYRSERHIEEFHSRVSNVFQTLSGGYEIIYVDDGSPDKSLKILQEIKESDAQIRIVKLSRNFGHHTAIIAGLEHSRGEYVFVIDSDLEEKPESLIRLLDTLNSNTDLEMVYGVQENRKGGVIERISGSLYYKIFNLLSNAKIEPNQLTSRIMTRKFVDSLSHFQDKRFTFLQLVDQVGYKSLGIKLTKEKSSPSTYSLSARLRLATKSFTLGSTRMLNAVFIVGLCVFGIGMAISVVSVIRWAISPSLPGWVSLLCSIWILGGILMMSVGILAKYLESALIESKNNPRYVVDWYL